MTQREFFENIINANINAEMTEFAQNEIGKLNKKNAQRKNTLSKEQVINERIKTEILNIFKNSPNTLMTAKKVTEIMVNYFTEEKEKGNYENIELEKLTKAKFSALLLQLEKANFLKSEEVKDGKSKVKGYKLS